MYNNICLILISTLITFPSAHQLQCDKSIGNDCGDVRAEIVSICAVCNPIASHNHRPLSCMAANHADRKFPDISIIHTTREEIRQDCGADSFKCTYTIACGGSAYDQLIHSDAVVAEIMNMGKQDPVRLKSPATFTANVKTWRDTMHNLDNLQNVNYQGKNPQKYDFIILSSNPKEIRFSNQVVGHTSMMTGDEYEAAKEKQLKVIWAGSFTVRKQADHWRLQIWENDSGHFLPQAGEHNINAKHFADYWDMPMDLFRATYDADGYFEHRRQQGVKSKDQRERELRQQLHGKKHPRQKLFGSSRSRGRVQMHQLRNGGRIGAVVKPKPPKPPNPDDPFADAHVGAENAYDGYYEEEKEMANAQREEVISPVNQYYSIKTDKGSEDHKDSGNDTNTLFMTIMIFLVVIIGCFASLFTGIIGVFIGRSMNKSNDKLQVRQYQKMDEIDHSI